MRHFHQGSLLASPSLNITVKFCWLLYYEALSTIASAMCHGDCRWDTATSTCTRKDSTEPPSVWSTKPISVDGTKAPRTRTPSGNYSGLQFNNPIHNSSVAPTNLHIIWEGSKLACNWSMQCTAGHEGAVADISCMSIFSSCFGLPTTGHNLVRFGFLVGFYPILM